MYVDLNEQQIGQLQYILLERIDLTKLDRTTYKIIIGIMTALENAKENG